ncbi:DUF421 domain-containing protein [Hymenobacter cellulosivorans]|uniref:DUF421 domain-containing protein n=1 Tax=Hymenobacter cellulosivorans TaxID=2932249 RepID=A0ABY4F7D8_9BACT|nr:YetF domain-containing protein [Hymenobacter cellulosivorans]UOQ52584.1 DUF421 domain-containing protein [Hymenobacter cellulosivorans]
MKKEEIHLGDWQRIVLGNAPGEYMLEVVLRTLIIYVVLLVFIRLLGKRMGAQLTITEMAVMLTLGAIIAVPAQIPDRGLLPAFVLLGTVLLLQRGVNWLALKNRKVEVVVQSDVSLLLKNGVLNTAEMKKMDISHEQVFAHLRSKDVLHLGQLCRVYLESGGHFSVFRYPEPQPGLSVLPDWDERLRDEQQQESGLSACLYCGNVQHQVSAKTQCTNCGHQQWTYAVQPQSLVEQEAEAR